MTSRKTWGILGLAVLSLSLLAIRSMAEETLLLRCESPSSAVEETTYEIHVSDHRYSLLKKVGGKEVAKMLLEQAQSVVGYGGTYLFFDNQGRSGYLLLYFHKENSPDRRESSLIDINLFQPNLQPMNSQGPRTNFVCKLAAG